jgi:UDP-N-acetyl-D-mannosaminuronate dehydrogenase
VLADADVVLIVTAHPGIDHADVVDRSRVVVDLRGVTRAQQAENVLRL